MPGRRKYFDTSGKSPALFHRRAVFTLLMALPNGPFGRSNFSAEPCDGRHAPSPVMRVRSAHPHARFMPCNLPLKSGNSSMAFPPRIIKPLIAPARPRACRDRRRRAGDARRRGRAGFCRDRPLRRQRDHGIPGQGFRRRADAGGAPSRTASRPMRGGWRARSPGSPIAAIPGLRSSKSSGISRRN